MINRNGLSDYFRLDVLLLLNCFDRAQLVETPWTAAHQAPPSMGFSRQEYWCGLQLPSLCASLAFPNFNIFKKIKLKFCCCCCC